MENGRFRVVIVEDNEADVFLIQTMLEDARLPVDLQVCSDGAGVLELIDNIDIGKARSPDLLLLDLNLPRYSGEEILTRFRQSGNCALAPVIIITSSDSPRDRERAAALNAIYFRKPADFEEFMKLGEIIHNVLAAGPRSE